MSITVAEFESHNTYAKSLPACLKKEPQVLISSMEKISLKLIEASTDGLIFASLTSGLVNPESFIWGASLGLGMGLTIKSIIEIYHPSFHGLIEDCKNWFEKTAVLTNSAVAVYFLAKIAVIGSLFILNTKHGNPVISVTEGLMIGSLLGVAIRGLFVPFQMNSQNEEMVPLL